MLNAEQLESAFEAYLAQDKKHTHLNSRQIRCLILFKKEMEQDFLKRLMSSIKECVICCAAVSSYESRLTGMGPGALVNLES